MDIRTNYRGHEIRYSENEDCWNCYDLDFSAPRLGGLKRKIDGYFRKRRKGGEVAAILVNDYSSNNTPVKITEYAGMKASYRGGDQQTQVYYLEDGESGRRKGSLSDFVHPGPEYDAYRELADRTKAQISALNATLRDARAALPRVSRDDIADLIRLYETENDDQGDA